MSVIENFLKMPLKFQINLYLIFVLLITIILIFFFSEAILLMNFSYIKSERKEYFLHMEQSIIENNINFINICLLQYENIIKLFNFQTYHFLNNETLIRYFHETNNIPKNLIDQKIVVIKNKSELDNYQEYNEHIPDKERKLYILIFIKIYLYLNLKLVLSISVWLNILFLLWIKKLIYL